ncbi:MAG: hypothetical protein LBP52_09775, partial [Burkholderiaceae bacterium]|nr:hypothetical protein [Burkholderiaceae bacterium]
MEQAHPEHHHAMGAIPSSEGDWDDILIFTGGDDGFPTLEKDRQRAEQGDVDSQFNLGLTYEGKGHPGVEPDNAQAVFWYEKAIKERKGAPQSDAQRAAQRNLTRLYENMEKERRNLIRLREEMERENNQKSGETGATPLPPAPETKTPEKRADAPTPAAQEADAAFGFQALGQLAAAQKSGGNLLIGPRNIRTALAA